MDEARYHNQTRRRMAQDRQAAREDREARALDRKKERAADEREALERWYEEHQDPQAYKRGEAYVHGMTEMGEAFQGNKVFLEREWQHFDDDLTDEEEERGERLRAEREEEQRRIKDEMMRDPKDKFSQNDNAPRTVWEQRFGGRARTMGDEELRNAYNQIETARKEALNDARLFYADDYRGLKDETEAIKKRIREMEEQVGEMEKQKAPREDIIGLDVKRNEEIAKLREKETDIYFLQINIEAYARDRLRKKMETAWPGVKNFMLWQRAIAKELGRRGFRSQTDRRKSKKLRIQEKDEAIEQMGQEAA